ncbi:hypothetical protein Emag_000269 [Eimeria magna]
MEAPSDPRSLLDSNAPFTEASVHLLDRVVAAMFGCSDQHSVTEFPSFPPSLLSADPLKRWHDLFVFS